MPLNPLFPTDPYVILDPSVRWYPGEEMLAEKGCERLLPPLVHTIRQEVKRWRDSGYKDASETTRTLLRYWFETEHLLPSADEVMRPFRYFFAQREAVESAIWLYEVAQARDPYALIKYDSSGLVSKAMFDEDWTRYVMKMATGSGKTKVMSLLIAWAYFHKRYEPASDLSTNFLVIAPNIIVLDRLRTDFNGLRIFYEDPVLPENGHEGNNWQDDFQITLHVQDEIGHVSDTGNIFLTNIHRVFQNEPFPSLDDDDTTDYFLGKRPTGNTNDSRTDLGAIIRDVPDLIVLNDEAHHIHDEALAWFKNLEEISNQLRLKGSKLSVQFDLTATPRHENGAIFVQTISDYPLVEAIRQGVVKTPVLPDAASRAELREPPSSQFTERYADYLHLGYLEWKKRYEELLPAQKKSVLFVMTDDTSDCDEVGRFLEDRYPELAGAVLVIHTKENGEISEWAKGEKELQKLRQDSREIDNFESPYKAIVSVMVLREGWDVQNVVSIVGLRPFQAASKILPEQTLGRGLRRMFRGQPLQEKVSVIGTKAFIDFIESIKIEGVDLEYEEMNERSKPRSPMVVEVDRNNPNKDIERLDIELPILAPRIYREYKNLESLDVEGFNQSKLQLKTFSDEEQRQIVFTYIDAEEISHTTVLDTGFAPNYQSVLGYFVNMIKRDLRLVSGLDILYGKMKRFIECKLFDQAVNLEDLNVLRNLSEIEAMRAILETFKAAVNALTVQDRGTTEVRDRIKFSKTRPFTVTHQDYLTAKRSIFSKIVGDSQFELEFAGLLDGSQDVISFVKNSRSTHFKIEYRTADGSIDNYYPDFVVKETEADYWIVETKGREDLDDIEKWGRLKQWCEDASKVEPARRFHPLIVRQEIFEKYRPKTFSEACRACHDLAA